MLFDIYKVCIFIGMYCFMFGFGIISYSISKNCNSLLYFLLTCLYFYGIYIQKR